MRWRREVQIIGKFVRQSWRRACRPAAIDRSAHDHLATPPCLEQAPVRPLAWLYVPSLHCAIAPAGLRSSTEAGAAAAVLRGAAAGLGAGVGEPPLMAFFMRWNRLGWAAGAAAGLAAGLVTLVATVVELLHCVLLAFPALV